MENKSQQEGTQQQQGAGAVFQGNSEKRPA